MSSSGDSRLGTVSTLSIGIGGMVGGGIFAVTGITVEVTQGAAPIAFLLAGLVALLTSYSYLKLTYDSQEKAAMRSRCSCWVPSSWPVSSRPWSGPDSVPRAS